MEKPYLTPRLRECANLILAGNSNREIGQTMGLTEATIKFYCTKIYQKYEVKSRSKFIVKANGGT